MPAEPRVLIIGAGPTGLGAAWRLHELGHTSWELYESSDHPGGLASSFVDAAGFTWDIGGHVLFSHYEYFDRLMVTALGDQWVEHVREAWVWMRQRWIPYPFQNNIWRLPEDELIACLEGLLETRAASGEQTPPRSFRDWLQASFGTGLCDAFMFPYNRKVWAYDPSALDVGWMAERVATRSRARAPQSGATLRRRGVGTKFDLPLSVARRHRRDLAVSVQSVAAWACSLRLSCHGSRCRAEERAFRGRTSRALRLPDLDNAARSVAGDVDGSSRSFGARGRVRAFVQPHRRDRAERAAAGGSGDQVLDLFSGG